MTHFLYLIWNGDPRIFSFSQFDLRWYGLMWAVGFLISQQVLYLMYRKEHKPSADVDALTIYLIIGTLLGARLGHVLFYQPELIWENPVGIFIPIEFSPFRFIGFQGLASHGAAIGICASLWLFARVKKQKFLHVLDRIVILVALTSAMIRFGNFMNSEIIGKPSNSEYAVVFVAKVTEYIKARANTAEEIEVSYEKMANASGESNRVPLMMHLVFSPAENEENVNQFISNRLPKYVNSTLNEFAEIRHQEFKLYRAREGHLQADIQVFGIARHAAQLYEAISCLLLFAFLFALWFFKRGNFNDGLLFGLFLVICFSLRILYEFFKENQVAFEDSLPLNMGQILSIPLVLVGLAIVIRAVFKKRVTANENSVQSNF